MSSNAKSVRVLTTPTSDRVAPVHARRRRSVRVSARCGVWVVVVGLLATSASAQVASPRAAVAPTGAAQPAATTPSLPVPDWLVWRLFYERTTETAPQTRAALEPFLRVVIGLEAPGRTALLAHGRTYLDALRAIDAQARATLQARYGSTRPGPGPETAVAGRARSAPTLVLALPAGTTALDLAKESGLYDQVEQQKAAALAAHLTALQKAIGAPAVTRLTTAVTTTVRPTIARPVPAAQDVTTRPATRGAERPSPAPGEAVR